MSIWIKICGNTSLEDAQLAASAGADAVGFVFAPSPRRVTVEQVAAIAPQLPAKVEKIGVFVETGVEQIARAVEACQLTGAQLHTSPDGSERVVASELRHRFGSGLRILQVVHFGENAEQGLRLASEDLNLDGVLIDSRTATALGGTGISFDWEKARRTILELPGGLNVIAAGGLSPGNVAEAIAILRPWGVDVVTGVEAAPGRKDTKKVMDFVKRARAADAQKGTQSKDLQI
jgi:phosphoribosylanthranilate isomerase